MARKPKAAEAPAVETKPDPVAKPDADTAESFAAEVRDEIRKNRLAPVVCMPVLYRSEVPHNGQTELAAIITGLPGEDGHGRTLAHLFVMPPMGTPFSITAPHYTDEDGEPSERTWRFPF